jgi:hypothetical protein
MRRETDARDCAQETESAIRQGRHLRPAKAKRQAVAEMIDWVITDLTHLAPPMPLRHRMVGGAQP